MTTSVAMCTYNGEKFLHEQINSILSQTKPVDEIIICDDGSTDSTISILMEYKNRYPNIFKIYQNEKNLRSVKNFEKAISLCNNEIIFLSDQDDIWLPEKVEEYLIFFNENPEIDVLCSNGFAIDEDGNQIDVITIWDVIKFLKERKQNINFYRIISYIGNIATGASMAIRKKIILNTLPFPEIKDFYHDEWLALISSSKEKFFLLDDKHFKYRKHSSQQVGGIFFENNKKTKETLINLFSINSEKKDFRYYKKTLKRLSISYKKNIKLRQSTKQYSDFFDNNIKEIKILYNSLKKELRKKYPLRFFILTLSDYFSGKRALKNE